MTGLEDKVVIITGASGGLGRSVTQAFLDTGATVVGVSRSVDSSITHPRFVAEAADLGSWDATRTVVDSIAARFGRIDVLAHLTGGFAGGASVAETEEDVWDRMLTMNLRTAVHATRAVIPHMRKANSGRILAIGSLAALEPAPGIGAYSASKAALVSLVRTIAKENKDSGITANAVLPGTMDTPANRAAMPNADPAKWIQPERVAALLVWLALDAAASVTGAAIPIYGADV
jgi:NAD(P)-dependent dehydrogenase (short-subunit alcohol dehydrogenase family)